MHMTFILLPLKVKIVPHYSVISVIPTAPQKPITLPQVPEIKAHTTALR